ncbi:MAG TPA: response regulator transcription factor [Salinivirgaceae bacterium]|nr:response regulator transcription factor [Salinivirgaceae bacterium]
MKKKYSIFLVEDDINFGTVLRSYLEMNSFTVVWVDHGTKVMNAFLSQRFDLCILDIMLPDTDGYTVAKMIREKDPLVPFIFVTAKTMKEDMLQGFKVGADDYITKPFDSEILLLKIRAIIRRRQELYQGIDQTIVIGIVVYEPTQRILTIDGKEEKLSPKEGKLYFMLAKNVNQVVNREIILKEIWGESNYFTARSMDVYITKLRKILKPEPRISVENIHGSGYMLKFIESVK